jgi:hypothetical protein
MVAEGAVVVAGGGAWSVVVGGGGSDVVVTASVVTGGGGGATGFGAAGVVVVEPVVVEEVVVAGVGAKYCVVEVRVAAWSTATGKSRTGFPSSAGPMKFRQISAGSDPPVTPATPST